MEVPSNARMKREKEGRERRKEGRKGGGLRGRRDGEREEERKVRGGNNTKIGST